MRLGLVALTLRGDCQRCHRLQPVELGQAGNGKNPEEDISGHRCTACGGPMTRLRLVDKAVASE